MKIFGIQIGKRKKKKVPKPKRNKEGREIHTIHFNDEEITVLGMKKGTEDRLLEKYKIMQTNAAVSYYNKQLDGKNLSELERRDYEKLYFFSYAELENANYLCGKEICTHCVQKPPKWFNTLSRDEWMYLILETERALKKIPIREIYFELIQELKGWYGLSKGKSTMTGEQVAKYIEEREKDYVTGEIKKNNLNGVSLTVEASTVRGAPTMEKTGQ